MRASKAIIAAASAALATLVLPTAAQAAPGPGHDGCPAGTVHLHGDCVALAPVVVVQPPAQPVVIVVQQPVEVQVPGQPTVAAAQPGLHLVLGSRAKDRLPGTLGNDVIVGLDGNDSLLGRAGADRLLGGRGNDILRGGAGVSSDVLRGGPGTDLCVGDGNDQFINCEQTIVK